ncbi:MAG TPA: hypothetical protein PLD36_13725, partial [Bacteroidia bacterium]|nr:hypothetical protein [Bacteroidia bacterium]
MINKLALICIFIITIFGNTLNAQRNNVWVFGDSALIDFNGTTPITGHSVIKSRGTAASICDHNGNLLFSTSYDTDVLIAGVAGGEVYDASQNLMQNGDNLKYGGWYQEAIIIPNPSDTNKYYIFHIGVTDYYGLYYSEIDLSLNGGLGSVTQKNIQLLSNKANDGLTAVKHGNGRDWWILFRESTTTSNANNVFYKYLVSPQGISGPYMQSIGTLTSINSYRYFFSKDGTKLGAVGYRGLIETYDLDRCSGQLSNYRSIKSDVTTPPVPGVWSGAFSPDGTKLYVATSYDDSYLWQFNLLDSLPQNTVDTLANFNFSIPAGGALKLAPDNKIYWSCAWNDGVTFNYPYPDTTYNMYNMNLSVINSPDSLGAACNFQPYSFYLGGKRTYWGLPNNPNYELGPLTGSLCDTLTVGLNEIANYKNNITVYYDALWQIAFVNAKGLIGKNYTLQLFNLNGQLILQEQGKLNSEYFTKDLNLLANSNGLYIVRL